MKILAVDDEPIFLDVLLQLMRSCNYNDVRLAGSAPEALDIIAAEAQPFDCFLLDVQMGGMDGIELCRQIRALPKHRLTPIVMITAMTEKGYVDEAFLAGANDYVTKPLDRTEVKVRMSMVKTILSERSHVKLLAKQIERSEKSLGVDRAFDTPLVLDDSDSVTPFTTLENYLLKLGNMRLFTSMAVGFHIENAGDIYDQTSSIAFMDMLTDAASVIADSIKSENHLLAYAGNGDFVAVLPRLSGFSGPTVQEHVRAGIEEFRSMYVEEGQALPRIRVGRPATTGLLSFGDPTKMIDEAIRRGRQGLVTTLEPSERFGVLGA